MRWRQQAVLANDTDIHLPVESSFEVYAESHSHPDPSFGRGRCHVLSAPLFCAIFSVLETESH